MGDEAWDDYRFSVGMLSKELGDIGVIFRYQDKDNYYRFSLCSNSTERRRLVKKVNGFYEILWESDGGFNIDHLYFITVDCVGNKLKVYLNGRELLAIIDGVIPIPRGKIGLYCWRTEDARFNQVRVGEATWSTYYAFSDEELLPPGTRLRVSSGNETFASASEKPNELHRFTAVGEDPGRALLTNNGVRLRVTDANNHPIYDRFFLPSDAYGEIPNARILRKEDGTGFFVLIPSGSGSQLLQGQYRLRMTYHRAISSVDEIFLVLKEVGSSDDENVILDIPWE